MNAEQADELARRAAMHNALGDPARLAIVDALALSDATPTELRTQLGLPSNLMAHHLGVLERAGILRRTRSHADRRRTYLGLLPEALQLLGHPRSRQAGRVVFVCTENAARSQLAAVLWSRHSELPAASAGIHPAPRVHPRTVAAARRHRLTLAGTTPRRLDDVIGIDDLIVTVCDLAHEEMRAPQDWLHWSIPDPISDLDNAVFDQVISELGTRMTRLSPAVTTPVNNPIARTGARAKR
jgi:protein-tyrosine-phosphatase/DNA-binding HxlR family transcriptional regulator